MAVTLRKLATVIGGAVTTFLAVGAATIEAVTAAVGGDIGPGIIGVFVGVAAGIAAAGLVQARYGAVAERTRTALLAHGAFGITLVFLASMSYVNVPGADEYLGLARTLLIAAVVAGLAAVGAWQARRTERSPAD